MIKVTKTVIKPDSEVALYSIPEEHTTLIYSNQQEGKLQKIEVIKDGLQTKFVWKWDSIESFNTYKNTSIYQRTQIEREAYNLANGIVSTEEMEEVVD